MITLLPVAVAITTSGLPPPRDQYFSRAASASCWYGRSSNIDLVSGRRFGRSAGQVLSTSVAHATGRGRRDLLPVSALPVPQWKPSRR